MSGVEVAGLVLGAMPIVINVLENYYQGVCSFKRYMRYRREVRSLIRRLKTQDAILRNSCAKLLVDIVPEDQMMVMLDKRGGPGWKDSEVNQRLAKRLGHAYTTYLETIESMDQAMNDLRMRLAIDLYDKEPLHDANSFKEFYKRWKFSMYRQDYEDLLNEIEKDNASLITLTSQSLDLEAVRATRPRALPEFDVIRTYARSLFSALRSSFMCGCQAMHRAHLLLEKRIDLSSTGHVTNHRMGTEKNFEILFAYGDSELTCQPAPWMWTLADIQVVEQKAETESLKSRPARAKKSIRFASSDTDQDLSKETVTDRRRDETVHMDPIPNLCDAMAVYWPPKNSQKFLGCLPRWEADHKHFIQSRPLDGVMSTQISLYEVLCGRTSGGGLPPLEPSDRRFLAATLSSSVLQLCGTPWLEKHSSLRRVKFLCSPDKVMYTQPCISVPLVSTTDAALSKSPRPLCAMIRNEFTFYLGVLLIELFHGKPIERLRLPSELNPDGTEHMTTDYATATRLMEEVRVKAGERYYAAVRRCIYCEFDQRTTSLEDPAFRRAVYERVVCPLEEDLKQSIYLPTSGV